MKSEKTIKVLNTLITINNDRIEGYETASNGTDELEAEPTVRLHITELLA